MTPLAQKLVRSSLKLGIPQDLQGETTPIIRDLLRQDCKCFELSEVWDLVSDLSVARQYSGGALSNDATIFHPAPVWWVEAKWRREACVVGYLVNAMPCGGWRVNTVWYPDGSEGACILPALYLDFSSPNVTATQPFTDRAIKAWTKSGATIEQWNRGGDGNAAVLLACASIINSPRVIKQVQHEPHAGLRRELFRAGATGRNHRLQPWITVKLDVQTTADIEDGGGRMTGTKALHFCRAHLRMTHQGKLTWVRSHWRGDAGRGLVTRDYRVKA